MRRRIPVSRPARYAGFAFCLACLGAARAEDPVVPAPPAAPPPGPQAGIPDAVLVHVRGGYYELREGSPEAAVAAFRKALEVEPGNKAARFGLGTALLQAENYRESHDVLLELAREYPDDYHVLNNLAWVYATARDIEIRNGDLAIRYSRAALMLAPEDHHVWSTLSQAYFVSGQYERALRVAQEALRIARQNRLPEEDVERYRRQVERCRASVSAMSILER